MQTPTRERDPISAASAVAAARAGVTWRAIGIALLLTILNDYWIVQLEVVRYSFATYAAPFYNCIFTLLVVTVVNFAVRRRFPRLALSRIELLVIYVMVSISSAVCSHNMMEVLVSLMGYAFFFQTPENKWADTFLDRLPHWLTVSDPDSLRNFYYGHSTLYDPRNFGPWVVPVLCWSAFCAVLLFTMLCLNSILRKQWTESERLTFPVVTLPLEMTEEAGTLFRNKYMWLGFTIAGVITLVAGLNYLYPSIPYVRVVRQNIGVHFTEPPWRALGTIPMGFYFWAIGLAFLMPLELSFSCWFFYWLVKLEVVVCVMFGLNRLTVAGGGFDNTYPFLNSQSYGAYLGFFAMSMWASRRYLGRAFRTAFLGTNEEDESREAMSYRTAFLGVIGGVLLLSAFARAIGMSFGVIMAFFTAYFVFAVIISRIRAELGFPTHDMHSMNPAYLINTVSGTQDTPKQDLVGFSLLHWFNRTYASHPAPHQLEGYKLADRTNTPARQFFKAMMIAGVVAMPIGFWMLLHTYFRLGGATANMEMWARGFGGECWGRLQGWIERPTPSNPTAMGFVGVGFVVSLALGWLRISLSRFPFHPLAYAIATSWGVAQLWMPLLIGSAAKYGMLKLGGLHAYRKALPFFLGLILGEITIGSLWTIYGIAMGIPTYDFWPGKMT